MPKTSVTFRLDQDLLDRIGALADRMGMTKTDIVEKSLIAGLKEGESHATKMENPVIRAVIEAALQMDQEVTPEDEQRIKNAMGKASERRKSRKK